VKKNPEDEVDDPMAALNALAKECLKKNPHLSPAQSFDAVRQGDVGRALFEAAKQADLRKNYVA
jgi:hypothetical protein